MTQVNYDFSLSGKVALVTGAAAGIGNTIANAFLTQGAKVAFLDINPAVSNAVETVENGRAIAIQADVTQRENVTQAIEQVKAAFGRIDILVNSAGIVLLDEAEHFSEQDWDRTLDVNLKGVYLLSQAAGKEMLAQGSGRIVNLASQAGVIALDRHLAYCVSKAGVISMTQVMALEWSPKGVTVNAISPTVVLTELGKKAWAGEVGEAMKQKIPARRFAEPEEIAAAAVYLSSDLAGMVTGANLIVDGGYTIQ
ncbi:D-threitol dehydrogenase [Photobacterium sp. GJ3]|uniref:SDR family oxidoreductase n=1 Tax=Photobacterium sp. GJ3 TaxID=2829502 RepID=UPI001B8B1374|nr:D-threitol dehydrogenase [Photobacterium sp. GJ3]QUJ67847.1 D-threitol dehydrogenase [Photobacterium sp. GJ3]